MDWLSNRLDRGPLTVAELNRLAREAVERALPLMWVAGEISNFTRAASGHWYFTLKDAAAQVRCVMFRNRAMHVDWRPENGARVEVRAVPSLYEARGDFQLGVEVMRRAGTGSLFEAFERLKARLEREGLFDPARKRVLPAFPSAVGVVTSPAAAALRDVLTTLRRRMPGVPVNVYPAPVQGEGAGERIARAIATAGARAECDVLIVCRGGGSIEDLWAFNEEAVARAIAASPIPVVSGVGHETDFTIADFVADVRAPTPTAAAQLSVPDRAELSSALAQARHRLVGAFRRRAEHRMQTLDYLARRLLSPVERVKHASVQLAHLRARLETLLQGRLDARAWHLRDLGQRLASVRPRPEAEAAQLRLLSGRLSGAFGRRLDAVRATLDRYAVHVAHLDPARPLARGFAIVTRRDGTIVRDATALAAGDDIQAQFARGTARARVTGTGN